MWRSGIGVPHPAISAGPGVSLVKVAEVWGLGRVAVTMGIVIICQHWTQRGHTKVTPGDSKMRSQEGSRVTVPLPGGPVAMLQSQLQVTNLGSLDPP